MSLCYFADIFAYICIYCIYFSYYGRRWWGNVVSIEVYIFTILVIYLLFMGLQEDLKDFFILLIPRIGFCGLILSKFCRCFLRSGRIPRIQFGDYAWGQNGLDNIISQVFIAAS